MKKNSVWIIWLLLTAGLGAFFATKLFGSGEKEAFLIGPASHGHYQIEMACETCHSEPFGGSEVLQNACTQCHAQELEDAHDSHPKSKFTDPRNADRVEILDARYCVTCHVEHQLEQTRDMGVTLPDDYCYHCHQDIEEDRPSHKDLAFDSCASAGCHNYHDNRALYEDFLVENAHQDWLKEISLVAAEGMPSPLESLEKNAPRTLENSEYSQEIEKHPQVANEWHDSSHAQAGVDCGGCHSDSSSNLWIEKPSHLQCKNCHALEVDTFLEGKHGMRLAESVSAPLNPITPGESHLPFKDKSLHLTHSCSSCHSSHTFDTEFAAVEACLTCHSDEHSLAYPNSKHGLLAAENSSSAPTCASCHMPRTEMHFKGKQVFAIQHNQNENLRPNEKMIRPVCMNCHSLEFSIDSLADPELIKNNFSGRPSVHIESIDWALERSSGKKGTYE